MTKVKDLIKNAVFTSASGFDELQPEVTIPLPTFRRGDNGHLAQCIDSILAQTFTNFELIIIDDASVDSTAAVIKTYMEKDPRIAVIRHEKNIGLPAVSEIEAFLKSRGKFFFWAFDDNEFKPQALQTLYDYLIAHPEAPSVYAIAEVPAENKVIKLGEESFDFCKLHICNYIPNAPHLTRREMLEEFGLYDPHKDMVRLCDWDLWLRIGKKHPFHNINEILNIEKGLMLNDSLCNAYKLDFGLMLKQMLRSRNTALRPENILEYEVDDVNTRPYTVLLCEKRDAKVEAALANVDEDLQPVVIERDKLNNWQLLSFAANAVACFFAGKATVEKLCQQKKFFYGKENLNTEFIRTALAAGVKPMAQSKALCWLKTYSLRKPIKVLGIPVGYRIKNRKYKRINILGIIMKIEIKK